MNTEKVAVDLAANYALRINRLQAALADLVAAAGSVVRRNKNLIEMRDWDDEPILNLINDAKAEWNTLAAAVNRAKAIIDG